MASASSSLNLWETPKLIILCECIASCASWVEVSTFLTSKLKHIPSVVALDWGRSFTPEEVTEQQCKRMFKAVASKLSIPLTDIEDLSTPAVSAASQELATRLRAIRIKQIQEVLKTLPESVPKSSSLNTKAPVVNAVPVTAAVMMAQQVKKEKTHKKPKIEIPSTPSTPMLSPSLPAMSPMHSSNIQQLPMPISIVPTAAIPLPESISVIPNIKM